jgi:phage baseplate assembly protein W
MRTDKMKSRFLQIPFRKGHAGGLAEIEDIDQHIKDKIMQVLFTIPGERVNLPEFGCRLRDLVFEGNNEILRSAVTFNISRSLTRWMGEEVKIEGVRVDSDEEDGILYIQIFYHRLDDRIPNRLEVAYKL